MHLNYAILYTPWHLIRDSARAVIICNTLLTWISSADLFADTTVQILCFVGVTMRIRANCSEQWDEKLIGEAKSEERVRESVGILVGVISTNILWNISKFPSNTVMKLDSIMIMLVRFEAYLKMYVRHLIEVYTCILQGSEKYLNIQYTFIVLFIRYLCN